MHTNTIVCMYMSQGLVACPKCVSVCLCVCMCQCRCDIQKVSQLDAGAYGIQKEKTWTLERRQKEGLCVSEGSFVTRLHSVTVRFSEPSTFQSSVKVEVYI